VSNLGKERIKEIEKITANILIDSNQNNKCPPDLYKICSANKIYVKRDLDNKISEELAKPAIEDNKSIIYLNPIVMLDNDKKRVRKIVAHELGHIFLHPDKVKTQNCSYSEEMIDTIEEKEAETFAEFLLLPEKDFELFWNVFEDKTKMEEFWVVPQDMISKRIKQLGLKNNKEPILSKILNK